MIANNFDAVECSLLVFLQMLFLIKNDHNI